MAAERHPDKVIQGALAYARKRGWTVIKSAGGSAHAWGVMRCSGDCPQVSIYSTPRVPENHARALRKAVDRCPHQKEDGNG
jgi:phosphoribosylcarboxyaminoimidazole (NCAIR) mutase